MWNKTTHDFLFLYWRQAKYNREIFNASWFIKFQSVMRTKLWKTKTKKLLPKSCTYFLQAEEKKKFCNILATLLFLHTWGFFFITFFHCGTVQGKILSSVLRDAQVFQQSVQLFGNLVLFRNSLIIRWCLFVPESLGKNEVNRINEKHVFLMLLYLRNVWVILFWTIIST